MPPHLRRQNTGNNEVVEVISDDSMKQEETNGVGPQRVGASY